MESILNPSEVIANDYSTMLILTKSGKLISGIKKSEDASSVDLLSKDNKVFNISKDVIKRFKTQKISMMPGNFRDLLSIQEVRDLLAFCKSLRHPILAGLN